MCVYNVMIICIFKLKYVVIRCVRLEAPLPPDIVTLIGERASDPLLIDIVAQALRWYSVPLPCTAASKRSQTAGGTDTDGEEEDAALKMECLTLVRGYS
jgi:hypothetical protein